MMKLMCIFGVVLALLVQASLQYPPLHHRKLLRFPEKIDDEAFPDGPNNNVDTNDKSEGLTNVEPPRINDVNVVLLDSEDFMNLIAAKASDDSVLQNRDYPQKRYRRRAYENSNPFDFPKPDPVFPNPAPIFPNPAPIFPNPAPIFPNPAPVFPKPDTSFPKPEIPW